MDKMEVTLLPCLLFIGALLHCSQAQVFSVGAMVFAPHCGLEDQSTSWQYTFKMSMPAENVPHFKNFVRVHTDTETICTINIAACEKLENISVTSDICYCSKHAAPKYELVVKRTAELALSEAPLMVSLPWLNECYPEDLTKLMTLLPPVYTQRTPVSATITVDDGVTQPLATKQLFVAVCNDHYVDLTLCVYNLMEPYTVKVTSGTELFLAVDECVSITRRFDFTEHPYYNLTLSYGESTWCPRLGEYIITFEETNVECGPEPCDDQPEPETCERTTEGVLPRYVAQLDEQTQVMCDSETDGGGWYVFLRRTSGALDFYRTYQQYRLGFGDVNGDHWFGLEDIHEHCFQDPCELRVDVTYNGQEYYAHYSSFWLEGGAGFYTLHVSGYSGDAGDSLTYHDGSKFTTHDQDHDKNGGNCAEHNYGGFWYKNCHNANPTGAWNSSDYGKGVIWDTLTGMTTSLSFIELKFRLYDFGTV